MNYKDQNNLFKIYHIRNLLRIFFLLGFILLVIRLENFLYSNEDDYCYPDLVNNELVISEQPTEDLILNNYNIYSGYHGDLISHVYETSILHSYKIAIYSYNCLILVKFKTLITKPIGNSNILSILQNSNIWHKSSEEGPTLLS